MAVALLVAIGIVPCRAAFFAPPRVGFKKMHDLVDQVSTSAYRNANDPVTDVPFRAVPFWLYEQRPLLRGGQGLLAIGRLHRGRPHRAAPIACYASQ